MNLPTFIAFRHLRSPQKGSFSTLAGILAIAGLGIGIAALIITLSILEGFETTISEKIAGFDGHIRLQHFMDTPVPEENPILDSLLGTSLGQTVIPFIQKPALLRKGSYAEGVIVEGLVVPDKKFGLTHIIVDGTLNLNPGSILIGKRLADNMSLQVGDKLALFDMESITGVSSGQRVKSFTITGLFHSGLLEYDRSIVYTSLKDAQHLFGMEKQISGLMLLFKNSALAGAAYSQLEAELDYPWYVMSWKDKHHVLFDWIRVQRWPILIIFGLIAFVGVVNIVSAMAMIIIEKIREIGIFTSLGFTPHAIRRVFLFEGTIIGAIGSLAGVLIALLLIWLQLRFQLISIPEDVYFMDRIPVAMNGWLICLIGFAGLVASMLASLLPTIKAAKIHPAEALRYE